MAFVFTQKYINECKIVSDHLKINDLRKVEVWKQDLIALFCKMVFTIKTLQV